MLKTYLYIGRYINYFLNMKNNEYTTQFIYWIIHRHYFFKYKNNAIYHPIVIISIENLGFI